MINASDYTISESKLIQKVALIGSTFRLLQSLSRAVSFERTNENELNLKEFFTSQSNIHSEDTYQ